MPPMKRTTKKTAASRTRTTKTRQQPAKRTAKAAAKKSTKKATKTLSPRHKAALATGRTEARHVAAYLDALEANKPRRGRQRTAQTIERQLGEVRRQIPNTNGIKRLELVSRRIELETELDTKKARTDLSELRKNFIRYAGSYARRKHIHKQAFREAGVPAADIATAKIP